MLKGDSRSGVRTRGTESCARCSVGGPRCSQRLPSTKGEIFARKMQRFLWTKGRLRTNKYNPVWECKRKGWARWRFHFKGVRYTFGTGFQVGQVRARLWKDGSIFRMIHVLSLPEECQVIWTGYQIRFLLPHFHLLNMVDPKNLVNLSRNKQT